MKILYVSTISNTINAFMIPHIEMLVNQGNNVEIACKVQKDISQELMNLNCFVHNISFNRNPLSISNLKAYKELKILLKKNKYDLVHTHTPVASVIVRLCCIGNDKLKVFYTAHGFHFHNKSSILSWLIYYPIEKWLSKYTDTLITINNEDYNRALNKFKSKRIKYIPGVGFDVSKFKDLTVDIKTKRQELEIPFDSFVILSVGELSKRKNHKVILKAIAKLKNDKIHYIICGNGPLMDKYKHLIKKLGIEKNVHLLGFRKDIAEICKASDLFAFPSLVEGLGIAALEAMACGLPIITSNIHGIIDYSINEKSGFTCNPKSVNDFQRSIQNIYENSDLRNRMKEFNLISVQKFDIVNSLISLNNIYNS